jgi:glycerol-3-phosphate acyltransferase PlsY
VVARFAAPDEDLSTTEVDIPGSEDKVVLTSVSSTSIGARKGPKWGCLAGILDILKAAIPTLVFRLWHPGDPYYLIVAVAAVVGHNWPVYHRFKGGRGISPIMGGMLVVDWLGLIVTGVVANLFGQLVLKTPMAGFSLSLPLLIPWFALVTRSWWHVGFAAAINVVYWIAVLPELKTYAGLRREGREADFFAAMSNTPMGRGREQLMNRLSFLKRRLWEKREQPTEGGTEDDA